MQQEEAVSVFQPFTNKILYYKYRQPLILVESLIIQSIHDKIWNHPNAIPIEHTDNTSQAGLALYKYFQSSYAHPDLEELMFNKHDLFVAILWAGENLRRKSCVLSVRHCLHCLHIDVSMQLSGQWPMVQGVRVLKFHLKYISPPGKTTFITAFQHALSVSLALFKLIQHKPHFTATLQNGSFILTHHVEGPVSLALQKVCEVVSLTTNSLKSCIEATLPSGVLIHDILVNCLMDDFSSVVIHKQPQNALILQLLVSQYWRALLVGPSGGKVLFYSNGVVHVDCNLHSPTGPPGVRVDSR